MNNNESIVVKYSFLAYCMNSGAMVFLGLLPVSFATYEYCTTFNLLDDSIGVLFLVLGAIMVFLGMPNYSVVITDKGIERFYKIEIFGNVFYEDKYGVCKWKDIVCITEGALFGYTVHFENRRKKRIVSLNLAFTNFRPATKAILGTVPSFKITAEAKRKAKKQKLL